MNPKTSALIDKHGRRIRKLRVSLLDACNFRCFYCMPIDAKFMPVSRLMPPEEIYNICETLTGYGLEQIRITGGEPTMRREFRDIVTALSRLNLASLGLTSNGLILKKHLSFLRETKCKNLNISLDSLDQNNFARITRRDVFQTVYETICQARDLGFQVKINTVLMRGINDHELEDFLNFSEREGIEVRFLEVMKIGQACSGQNQTFMPADEAIARFKELRTLRPVRVDFDSTSFTYETDQGGKIGFIASESKPFCGSCSRWRLSADGFLRACLMSERGIRIRGVKPQDYEVLLQQLLPMKPTGRIEKIEQDMNQIGG